MTEDRVGDGQLVQLLVLPSQTEAEILALQLISNGVRAVVFPSDASGWAPHLGLIQGARLMVFETDLDAASDLLEDLESLAAEDGGPTFDQ